MNETRAPLGKTLFLLFKLAVSGLLLAYLLSGTDLKALLVRVRTSDTLLMAVAVTCYALMLVLSTWRWQLLLSAQGYPAPLRDLSASYLVATFFNNFLPSNIGGDVVRVRDSSRLTGSVVTSLAVVAVDRIVGLGALYALAAVAYLLGGPQARGFVGPGPRWPGWAWCSAASPGSSSAPAPPGG